MVLCCVGVNKCKIDHAEELANSLVSLRILEAQNGSSEYSNSALVSNKSISSHRFPISNDETRRLYVNQGQVQFWTYHGHGVTILTRNLQRGSRAGRMHSYRVHKLRSWINMFLSHKTGSLSHSGSEDFTQTIKSGRNDFWSLLYCCCT